MVVTSWTPSMSFRHGYHHHVIRPPQQHHQQQQQPALSYPSLKQKPFEILSLHPLYFLQHHLVILHEQTGGNNDNDVADKESRTTNDDTQRIQKNLDRVVAQRNERGDRTGSKPLTTSTRQSNTPRTGNRKDSKSSYSSSKTNKNSVNSSSYSGNRKVPAASALPTQDPNQQQGFVSSKGSSKNNNRRIESSISKQATSASALSTSKGKRTDKMNNNKNNNNKQSKVGSGNGFGKDRPIGTATTASTLVSTRTKNLNGPILENRSTLGTTPKKEFTSLLPPYSDPNASSSSSSSTMNDRDGRSSNMDDGDGIDDDDDFVTNGLSSWEQFLGRGNRASPLNSNHNNGENIVDNRNGSTLSATDPDQTILESVLNQLPSVQQQLPSIQDLFPPDLTTLTDSKRQPSIDTSTTNSILPLQPSSSSSSSTLSEQRDVSSSFLDGVLPVSDLFYRSSQQSQQQFGGDEEHDDEELPFSAEQSDAITSDENKVRVRQNMIPTSIPQDGIDMDVAPRNVPLTDVEKIDRDYNGSGSSSSGSKDKNRKMIRRGMEMLVGGIPIQADPPQRSVQITYNQPPKDGAGYDWASTISLNTREFGPLLHTESIAKVPDFERGLFCEFFCHFAIKWDVCPKDLRQIVNTHRAATIKLSKDTASLVTINEDISNDSAIVGQSEDIPSTTDRAGNKVPNRQGVDQPMFNETGTDGMVGTSGEIRFEIGVTREELEMGSGDTKGSDIFRSVFKRAFHCILERAINTSTTRHLWDNVVVDVPTLTLQETDDGYTSVCAEFRIDANITSTDADREIRLSKVGSVFSRSMDDGGFALAIAAAAKDETRWPKAVRNRVVEECLFQDDDGDESTERLHWTRTESPVMYDREVGLVLPARIGDGRNALYKGGGTDGVFHDFSAMNALNAPYSGEIGLRLVDAVTVRAKQRHPKVIAIGDVHGCIDELQDLLRQCDFRPGDLVVFLGDLVCKGPDSVAVVQMAREIGAIGVRGNHDFEVVRWHQAIKSGVDPPVFGSEHYHIAACLSNADMNWMHSLPWYISSKDLSTLFVHAGFVSGIRLAKQNPRLMMNMRSILPDGTVTSKFFNNWPWARLWDGPQTVLFGHDADRGLQQYEHAIGLDTGCVYGGRLTACILPEKKLVSVSAKRQYFKYRRKHYD